MGCGVRGGEGKLRGGRKEERRKEMVSCEGMY